jgi:HEAT repeat protein
MSFLRRPDISELKASGDMLGLIKAPGSRKPDVRQSAADALRELGDPRVPDPLLARLRYDDAAVRNAAVYGLGGLGDPRAAKPLETAHLEDQNEPLRTLAFLALDELRQRWGLVEAGRLVDEKVKLAQDEGRS